MTDSIYFSSLVLLLAVFGSLPVRAQPDSGSSHTQLDVRPHLATDRDTWTPGLSYDALYRQDAEGSTRSWFAELASAGRLLLEPRLNTEPLTVDLAAGFVVNFVQVEEENLLPITTDPDTVERRPLRDYGRLDAALNVGFETNQTLDDQQVTAGLEAGYVNIKTVGIWGWVPSLVVSARGVVPIEATAREAIGADTDAFVSLRGVATIAPRIGELFPWRALKPLGLHVKAEGHWELGTGGVWRDTDRNTAGLIAGTLLYAVNQRVRFLDQVYARWSRGRVPPNPIGDSTWTLGVVLYTGS